MQLVSTAIILGGNAEGIVVGRAERAHGEGGICGN